MNQHQKEVLQPHFGHTFCQCVYLGTIPINPESHVDPLLLIWRIIGRYYLIVEERENYRQARFVVEGYSITEV